MPKPVAIAGWTLISDEAAFKRFSKKESGYGAPAAYPVFVRTEIDTYEDPVYRFLSPAELDAMFAAIGKPVTRESVAMAAFALVRACETLLPPHVIVNEDGDDKTVCPLCEATWTYAKEHADDCPIQVLRQALHEAGMSGLENRPNGIYAEATKRKREQNA